MLDVEQGPGSAPPPVIYCHAPSLSLLPAHGPCLRLPCRQVHHIPSDSELVPSLHPRFFVLKLRLMFLEQFQVHNKIQSKEQRFPINSLPPDMLSPTRYQPPPPGCTFGETAEPTSTHHCHPRSMADTAAHSWHCALTMWVWRSV